MKSYKSLILGLVAIAAFVLIASFARAQTVVKTSPVAVDTKSVGTQPMSAEAAVAASPTGAEDRAAELPSRRQARNQRL